MNATQAINRLLKQQVLKNILQNHKMSAIRTGLIFIIYSIFIQHLSMQAEDNPNLKYTISGYVKDAKSGEDIIGAHIYIVELKVGVATNAYGYFAVSVPAGTYTIQVMYVGYTTIQEKLVLDKNISKNFTLQEAQIQMEEVVITEKKADENVASTQMSVNRLTAEQMKKVPALFGEVDLIKNIQMLPGVQSVGEGTSAFYVRGGSADQNLILLDEAPVYNPQHLFGIFSTFNADVIKSADVYKGGITAQYGGRLASVVDIRTKDGNVNTYSGSASLGVLSARGMIEGPIVKDKASFVISARRTYFDAFTRLYNRSIEDQPSRSPLPNYHFYDFNVKLNYRISQKDRVFLAGYFGQDKLSSFGFGLDWSNGTGTIRWNHVFNSKLFSNTTLVYSDFNYGLGVTSGAQAFRWQAGITELLLKQDFNWYINPKNEMRFGIHIGNRQFQPGKVVPKSANSIFKPYEMPTNNNIEHSYYVQNEQKVSERISLNYGLRFTLFHNNGTSLNIYRDGVLDPRNVVDTLTRSYWQVDKTYYGFEPRASVKYAFDEKSSVKASYQHTYQFLHMLTPGAVPLPITMWLPSSRYTTPQYSDQIAAGYFRNFYDNMFETSAEGYYKWIGNAVDFKDNAQLLLSTTAEAEILRGKGRSYGAEFYIRKNKGKLTGNASYTLSWTEFKIDGINDGKYYYAPWDRRHNFVLSLSYEFSKRVFAGANWSYMTGRPITLAVANYEFDNTVGQYITDRNAQRIPDFHRLDLSLSIKSKEKVGRKWNGMWNFSVYNAYYRKNPFSVFIETNGETGDRRIVQTYLLGVIPSVAYTINF